MWRLSPTFKEQQPRTQSRGIADSPERFARAWGQVAQLPASGQEISSVLLPDMEPGRKTEQVQGPDPTGQVPDFILTLLVRMDRVGRDIRTCGKLTRI